MMAGLLAGMMRLLADENFPRPLVEAIRASGHDVLWARTECAGWSDALVLERAESEARIVLTLDKDFWQIALQRRTPLEQSGVVLFRVHPATPENLAPLVRTFLEMNTAWVAHISIVSADGIQMLAAREN
jgi:predicted nuclease of predicted toxin-antitoxin system